jgi:hypothetical protein
MISPRSIAVLFAATAGLFTASAASAGCCDVMDHDKMATVAASTDKAAYPLDTCVVSGDKLEGGGMGGPVDYIYKQEGKPDRLVRFCCKSCIKDFKKDPAKYLKLIDEAAAAKAKAGSAQGHMEHMH